jgi:CubicO group peptidase (beta-lactamase class C family)
MKITSSKAISFASLFFLVVSTALAQNLTSKIDALIAETYPDNAPGISLLIAKNGKAIYQNEGGLANIELQVPINENSVFEIGSITKQFTSTAILMLEEQGKLSLDDEITKYIPDYPTKGHKITIHHLLNHTSGIKSYTSMQSFFKLDRTDMTPTELIDVFKNEPMDFNPGDDYKYNNSGYILLGHIIEVISKESYADFIQKHIFTPLEMTSSYYGSMKKIIPNRASGYSPGKEGMANANYLSLTLPYAGGSLMSTTGDLLKWQNAVRTYKLISKESYDKATNGSVLNSGRKIDYGYGWSRGNVSGSATVEHSGGIYGFTANGIYLPEEDIYVIGLTNSNGGSSNVVNFTRKVAAIAIGKPFYDAKDAITLSESQLRKWAGTYQFDENVIRYVTVKEGKIFSQREGSAKIEIFPLSENTFMFPQSRSSYAFSMKDGKKEVIFKGSEDAVGKEIDKAPPTERKEITLAEEILKQYIGSYQIQEGFNIDITVEEGKIFGEATGQPKFQFFPYAENGFFLKAFEAEVTFDKNDEGKVFQLNLHQNGRKTPAKKLD